MTPNDAQIDLLLRRLSRKAGESPASEVGSHKELHLDVDELNAFAEGALPAAARARYVSHLADCNNCRKLATQLTMAAGRTVEARSEATDVVGERSSLWQSIGRLFRVPNLRYAAFALVVVAAAGITFIALRHRAEENRPDSTIIAGNTQPAPAVGSAIRPADEAVSRTNQESQSPQASATPATSQNSNGLKQPQPGLVETKIGPAKGPLVDKNVQGEEKKKTETDVAQAVPSYAPAPPGERGEPESTEEQRSKDPRAAAPAPKQSLGNFKNVERSGGADEAARNREMEVNRARSGLGGANRNE